MSLHAHDSEFANRVRTSFAKQHAMALIHATLPVGGSSGAAGSEASLSA